MRLLINILCVVLTVPLLAQSPDCPPCLRYHHFVPSQLYPDNPLTFDIRFSLTWQGDELLVEDTPTAYTATTRDSLSRAELSIELTCLLKLESISPLAHGTISDIHLATALPPLDQDFTLITITDLDITYYYLLQSDGLHQLKPCLHTEKFQSQIVRWDTILMLTDSFVYLTDTSTHIDMLDIRYDTLRENILVKEAYSIADTIPITIDTLVEYVSLGQTSNCAAAIIDTIEEVLIKEREYARYEIDSAEFETVTEQVLTLADGPTLDYFISDDLDTTTLRVNEKVKTASLVWLGSCSPQDMLPCWDIETKTEFTLDTNIHVLSYAECPEGYKRAGKYCYKYIPDANLEFETRTYQKLIQDLQIHVIAIPAVYRTVYTTSVRNSQELPASCIQEVVDTNLIISRNFPFPDVISVPAEYGIRSYVLYRSGKSEEDFESLFQDRYYVFEKLEREIKSSTTIVDRVPLHDCLRDRLAAALWVRGYLDTEHVDLSTLAKALTQYQYEHNLPMGTVDLTTLSHLNLEP